MTQKTFQMTPVVRAFAVGLLALSQMGVALGAGQPAFSEHDIVANGFGLAEALKTANVPAEKAAQVAFNYIVTVHHKDILDVLDGHVFIANQYVESALSPTRAEFNEEEFAESETEAKEHLQKRIDALKWCVEHVTDLDPEVKGLLKTKIDQVEKDKDNLDRLCLDCRFGAPSLPKNFYTPNKKHFTFKGDGQTRAYGYYYFDPSTTNPEFVALFPPTPEELKANLDKLVPYTQNGLDPTDANSLNELRGNMMDDPENGDPNDPASFYNECGKNYDQNCKPYYEKALTAKAVDYELLVAGPKPGGGGEGGDPTPPGPIDPPTPPVPIDPPATGGGEVDGGGGGAPDTGTPGGATDTGATTGGGGAGGTGTPTTEGGGSGTPTPGPVVPTVDVLYGDVKPAIDAAKTDLEASPEDVAKQAKLQEEMDKLPTAKVKGVDLARIEGVVDTNTEALTRHETILNNHGDLIEKNKSDLTAHEVTLRDHATAIEANRVAIETVKRDLETQKGEIDAQAGAINTNREGIADNGRAIERNRGQIAENAGRITANTNRLTTQGEALSTVEGRISDHTTRIETNAELIRGLSLKDVQLGDGIRALNDRITDVDDEFKKGAAMNIALTGLFQPYNVEKHNIAVSLGGYKSALAIALGTGYRYNDKVAVRVGASTALKHGNGFAFNVALDYRFGD